MDNNFAKKKPSDFSIAQIFAVNSRLLVSKIFASWAIQLVNCYFLTFFSMKLHLQLASVCAGNLVNWIVWSKQKINRQQSHVRPLQVESVGRKMTKKCCNFKWNKSHGDLQFMFWSLCVLLTDHKIHIWHGINCCSSSRRRPVSGSTRAEKYCQNYLTKTAFQPQISSVDFYLFQLLDSTG